MARQVLPLQLQDHQLLMAAAVGAVVMAVTQAEAVEQVAAEQVVLLLEHRELPTQVAAAVVVEVQRLAAQADQV